MTTNKLLILSLLATTFLWTASCSSSFTTYKKDMFQGKELLDRGEFGPARDSFVKAVNIQPDAPSLAFAATASYKAGDLKAAARYMREADELKNKGSSDLRIAGYKALILFAMNRKTEAMTALREYIHLYSHLHPLRTIHMAEDMVKKDKIEPVLLEVLVDDQTSKYEDEAGQWTGTHTDFGERAP